MINRDWIVHSNNLLHNNNNNNTMNVTRPKRVCIAAGDRGEDAAGVALRELTANAPFLSREAFATLRVRWSGDDVSIMDDDDDDEVEDEER